MRAQPEYSNLLGDEVLALPDSAPRATLFDVIQIRAQRRCIDATFIDDDFFGIVIFAARQIKRLFATKTHPTSYR
jgi:hypothetical protein